MFIVVASIVLRDMMVQPVFIVVASIVMVYALRDMMEQPVKIVAACIVMAYALRGHMIRDYCGSVKFYRQCRKIHIVD